MILLPLLLATQAAAPAAFPEPDCGAVPGWRSEAPPRSYDRETLFDYMNGNSEGYFAYGFTLMRGVTCVNAAGDRLVIDVSELGDADRAWGFLVTNRDARSPVEAIGSGAQILPRKAAVAKGRYYLEIAASPDQDHRNALRAFVTVLLPRIPGEAHVPDAVAFFPEQDREPGSLRLVPESLLGLRVLKTGFIAKYPSGRAFVAPEKDAAAASETMAKLRQRFADAQPVPGFGDGAFTAQDRYLGGLVFFRKGARLAGVANVPAGQDGLPLARALAARLP